MREPRAWLSIAAVLLSALICFAGLSLVRGVDVAGEAFLQMLSGGVVGARSLGEAATKASLLTLTGLSITVALTVGLFNLGAQGQFTLGALTAALVGQLVGVPFFAHPWLSALAAAAVGAAWALIPAVLKLRRGVHEVISTILLNWVAALLVESWLVPGPLRAHAEGTLSRSGTDDIALSAQLPRLLGEASRLNAGFVLSLLLAAGTWAWLRKTTHGFESRAVGLSPEAALAAGIPVQRRVIDGMLASGALAGLSGALWVLGTEYKFPATVSGTYGFDGIATAFVGQLHPVGVVLASAFFGVLRAGGTRMQLLGVHKSFPELIQGLTLFLVAASSASVLLAARRRGRLPVATAPSVARDD